MMATTTIGALLRLCAFGVVVSTEAAVAASSCLDGVTALPRSLLSKNQTINELVMYSASQRTWIGIYHVGGRPLMCSRCRRSYTNEVIYRRLPLCIRSGNLRWCYLLACFCLCSEELHDPVDREFFSWMVMSHPSFKLIVKLRL